jgi:hypothetical protein
MCPSIALGNLLKTKDKNLSIINKTKHRTMRKKKAEVGMKNAPKKVDHKGNWNKSDTRTTAPPKL